MFLENQRFQDKFINLKHDIQLDPSGSAVAEYNMLEGWLIWIKQVKPDAAQEVLRDTHLISILHNPPI